MKAVGFKTLGGQIIAFLSLCILFSGSLYYFLTTAFDTGVVFAEKEPDILYEEQNPILYALVQTDEGTFKIRFLRTKALLTVKNFIKLSNKNFYSGTQFHRVVKNYLVQGGDPTTTLENKALYGTGGPGYQVKDEINDREMRRGVVAMANYGKDTNGSQFFILVSDAPKLQGKFTIFGEVVEGMDVVDIINKTDVDEKSIPIIPIRIKNINLLETL
jgi:cyclophilin family peptidyl-prolyl cis-trans isomerase